MIPSFDFGRKSAVHHCAARPTDDATVTSDRRLVFIGDEQFPTFAKAWAAVPDRAQGRRIHRRCSDPRFLRYDEAGRFGTYVERLFSVVGKERCLPVIFDDLSKDPEGQYRRVMDFCGLEPVPGMDFTAQRTGRAFASIGCSVCSSGLRHRSGITWLRTCT